MLKIKKINVCLLTWLILLITSSCAFAADVVPGDVIVVFKNNTQNRVSTASLAAADIYNNQKAGEHFTLAQTAAEQAGGKLVEAYTAISEQSNSVFALVHSDTKSEQELLNELKARPDVAGVSLNYRRSLMAAATPNDTYYSDLWGMKAIKADQLWGESVTYDTEPVYVAVIDSGIYADHEDLSAVVATEYCKAWYQPTGGTIQELTDYSDVKTIGHGTHVSGTIAAVGNNSKGVAGVAWKGNVKIIMLKPFDENHQLPDAVVIEALDYVLSLKKSGVAIAAVNMSIGGWEAGDPETESNSTNAYWAALKAVSDADIVICMSAGNEGQPVGYPAPVTTTQYNAGDYIYPASYRNIQNMLVVAAASKDAEGKYIRSTEGDDDANSNYGPYVHITAPGAHIVSTVPDNYEIYIESTDKYEKLSEHSESSEFVAEGVNNYAFWPGTSMAAPHVTGSVAILKSIYPNATAAQIKQAILDGANADYCKNDKGNYKYDTSKNIPHADYQTSAYGLLDVLGAYKELAELQTTKDTAAAALKPSVPTSDTTAKTLSGSDILEYDVSISRLDSDLQSVANSGTMRAVSRLPQIKPASDGTYYIKVAVSNSSGYTGKLYLFTGEGGSVSASESSTTEAGYNIAAYDYDSTAKFYASDSTYDAEITNLDASATSIIAAVSLKAGAVYTPVLSVSLSDSEADETEKSEKAEELAQYRVPSGMSGTTVTSGEIVVANMQVANLDSGLKSAVSTGGMSVVAVLPQITASSTNTYIMTVVLSDDKSSGTLRFFPGKNGTYNAASAMSNLELENAELDEMTTATAETGTDGTAKFYTASASPSEITKLEKGTSKVLVAAKLEQGVTYTPVVAVQNATSSNGSSSSGCNAGLLGFAGVMALLALTVKNIKK